MDKIDKRVYLAMLAEQSQRFEDMMNFLEEMILSTEQDISADERNLLSISYKNAISHKRQAVRTLLAYEMKEKKKDNSLYLEYITEYKKKLEIELTEICLKIIRFITVNLIPRAISNDGKLYYLKLIADYHRYIAENLESDNKKHHSDLSIKYYNEATEVAKKLPISDPIRLGLALNFSVFYYEVINNQETAKYIAESALKDVKEVLQTLDENDDEHKDTFSIVDLLNENLNMWNIETDS